MRCLDIWVRSSPFFCLNKPIIIWLKLRRGLEVQPDGFYDWWATFELGAGSCHRWVGPQTEGLSLLAHLPHWLHPPRPPPSSDWGRGKGPSIHSRHIYTLTNCLTHSPMVVSKLPTLEIEALEDTNLLVYIAIVSAINWVKYLCSGGGTDTGDFCNCRVLDLYRNPKYIKLVLLNHILTWLWCPSPSLSPVSPSLQIYTREKDRGRESNREYKNELNPSRCEMNILKKVN